MPLSLEQFDPKLYHQASETYDRSRRAMEAKLAENLDNSVDSDSRQQLGQLSLAETLRQQTAAAKASGEGAFAKVLETLTNPETKAAFERAFTNSRRIIEFLPADKQPPVPTPEQMARAGVDFDYLAKEYQRMKDEELVPHVVLAPQGLGLEAWQEIYANATATYPLGQDGQPDLDQPPLDNKGIPNNPLMPQNDGYGLYINYYNIKSNWSDFDRLPTKTTTPGQTELPNLTTTAANQQSASWTIRLISGTKKPQNLNMSYHQASIEQNLTHQTIAEALTDKLGSIIQGETPSDKDYSSWVDNGISQIDALDVRWDSDFGQVGVTWDMVCDIDDGLGLRSAVG